ncbi:putative importin subunit beta-4 [Colletotrichum orbiculare MAFF 240422]|uniref:Importin subunit beta-4 n=1 Tax=Colletotrichum orbiculare (strain 104-T / ATCC 96160 / CBS 514.97 / LARS 414 / MAFF 240422) TaxID=1213857 RepID=N4VBP5_COLOR|nr:putative importin subunit beta-4 [Colletotrichum orbiculare MAFF 240422]
MDKGNLVQLLQQSQIPDTEKVKAVTAELQKNYYSQPESLLLLIEITVSHEDAGIRQLASVQALRLISKHWKKLPADKRDAAKKHILESILSDQSASSRHSKSHLIAGAVGVELEDGQGEDFVINLLALNTSDNVAHREVGSYVLFALLDNDPTPFAERVGDILALIKRTIVDPASADVRLNAAKAVGAVLMLVDDEDQQNLQVVHELVKPLVDILKAAIEAGNDDQYKDVFEVFQSFLAYDSALLGNHLKDLLQFMLELAVNTDVEEDARSQALSFLSQAARYRRMKIQGMKDMGALLMAKSMQIVTEIDNDADADEDSPARTALGLIDQLASDLPPTQVINPLLDQFPNYAQNPNPGFRKAAILSLGTAAEGAPDFIATQLQSLMPTVLQLLTDQDVSVRHAALIGLIHLADEMADELSPQHEQLIGALLHNLEAAGAGTDKQSISIIRAACGALDSLIGEGLDEELIKAYGPKLIVPMGKLLGHDESKVKSAAAGAIGAVASALGGEHFKPYFNEVMTALGQYVTIKGSEEALELRSAVCDSMGRIADAVGPQEFQPYVMDLMTASEEALSLDSPRLKETSFILWASLSKVYGSEFAHFLPGVFQGLFKCLELEEEEISIPGLTDDEIPEGGVLLSGGKKLKVKAAEKSNDDDMSDDEDWEDEDFTGVTAAALEQEIALEVLGDVITHSCGAEAIQQYLNTAMEKVSSLAQHPYEGARKAAISTLWRSYARVWQLFEEQTGAKWEAGLPLKQQPDAVLVNLGKMVVESTLIAWAEDDERTVITEINRNIAATLKACGPAILTHEDLLKESFTVLGCLITKSHPCQQDFGDEIGEPEEGSSEFDWLVIDTAMDVILGLATALGSDFAEFWKVFEQPILKFASSQQALERSTSVGVIAEVIKYMGNAVSPFTTTLLPVLSHRLTDEDTLAKSNAAYAIGQLIYNSTETNKTIPEYPNILQKLEPLLNVQESRMVDNVSGCLSRMIIASPNPELVDRVLPAIVNVLPLKEDYEENAPIYEAIFKLYDQQNPTVQQLTPKILPILQAVLSPPEDQLEPQTRELVQKLAQALH